MDFNSFMIFFSLCSRGVIVHGHGVRAGHLQIFWFSLWTSAISRLRASTRSLIPPSIKFDYIFGPTIGGRISELSDERAREPATLSSIIK